MTRVDKFQNDKIRLLGWFEKYCYGYKNARTRDNILPFVQMPDRYFREVVSSLIHEGNVCSSHKRGYWFPPLSTNDPREIDEFKACQVERKGKALDLITDCERLIKQADDMLARTRQGQQVFA